MKKSKLILFLFLVIYSKCRYEIIATFDEEPDEYCCTGDEFNIIPTCTKQEGEEYLYILEFNEDTITSTSYMFSGCESLVKVDLSNFDGSTVTEMTEMFSGCSSLESVDLSNFDASIVTNMDSMFLDCESLISLNLNNFKTSLITTMASMFSGCYSLESLDLSKLSTSKLQKMDSMFEDCENLISVNLQNLKTSLADDMSSMFSGCTSLESLNLNNFDTSLVKNMAYMFAGCSSLKSLVLSSFTTTSVTSMVSMFEGCSDLKILNIGNFIFKSDIQATDMFTDCNQDMIYCINKDNAPATITSQLEDYPNLLCSDTCYQNEDNKIIPCKNSCIDDCQNDKAYNYEYNGKCYLLETHDEDQCYEDIVTEPNQSQEEIMAKLNNLVQITEPTKSYLIEGESSMIIIKPLNAQIEGSSVNVDFSRCEEKLKEIYPEKNFRILQINMDNQIENIVVDQVEYQIYDENDEIMDISICEDLIIPVEYKINISTTTLNKALYFQNLGIDIFNLNDEFFNDMCYPYTDTNTSCDMILSDRVKDIYQNVSLCGEGCEYQSVNLETKSSNCNCKMKKDVNLKPEKGNFKTYIMSAFLESNFGVIKCYNLVFSSKNKLSNIGFWVFGVMILAHIPIYIFQLIYGTKKMTNFILKEMNDKGYTISNDIKTYSQEDNLQNNPPKKKKRSKSKFLENNIDIIEIDNNKKNNVIKGSKNIKRNTHVLTTNGNLNNININSNDSINNNEIKMEDINEENDKNSKKDIKLKKNNSYSLILINANNEKDLLPYQSDYIIDNFEYEEAIIYENRSYCRIFFILLIAKENILNMIFFNPPLEFKPIRLAIFIFNFACDFALNAFFYLSDNISDRYNYEGIYRELYCIINNLTISLTSTIVTFLLLFFVNTLSQSSKKIENLFRVQEKLLKKDDKYKVNNGTKIEIKNKIKDILRCLRIKIIFFIILEFLILIFFFYYVTIFCQVYKNTQVSWFLDFISSYVISLGITVAFSLVFAFIYKLSIRYKIKIFYKLTKLMT